MAYSYDGYGNKIAFTSEYPMIFTGELPKIFITSNTEYNNVTKETAVSGTFTLIDWKTKIKKIPIKFKLQGSGSLAYAKKNLNITFYNADGEKQKYQFNHWYPTSKIHLKANEYDFSMVRNSVGTRLAYSLMGKNLPNGAEGYINSFPVVMYYNGQYMGCHTVNLPQDGNTYNFDEDEETACKHLAYRSDTLTAWDTASNWEYRGDADETDAMKSTFATAHSVMCNFANLTTNEIESHFDKQTLVGYLTFAQMGLCPDSMINNWTLITWDGVIWYHGYYDLDICFGIGGADGKNLSSSLDVFTTQQASTNGFFLKCRDLYMDDMRTMYAKWRNSGVDAEYIYKMFHDFQMKWGWQNIEADRTVWADDKQGTNDISLEWITDRIAWCDTYFEYSAG